MQTGYPSIDKPWLKYYKTEDEAAILPPMTRYQMLYNSRKEYLDDDCVHYYGSKITYQDFMSNIHRAVNVFVELGIKKVM